MITLTVYGSGTTKIVDPLGETARFENLQFATGYPGGLYLEASFYITRDIAAWWELNGAKRVSFYSGLKPVYEGYITTLDYALDEYTQGVQVNCVGAWSKVMMSRRWRKYWSDTRLDESVWVPTVTQNERFWTIDRANQLKVVVNSGTYAADTDYCYLIYTYTAAETIKRITYHYDFVEGGGQNWRFSLWRDDPTPGEVAASVVTATGNADIDYTFATPANTISFRLLSKAGQTVGDTDNVSIALTDLRVLTESDATIDLTVVAADVVGKIAVLNTTTAYISAMASSRSLIGTAADPFSFGAFSYENLADLLMSGAMFGDADNDPWAVGLLHSEDAPAYDGKPVLYCEEYPVTTDYDYIVDLADPRVQTPIGISQDYGQIVNWVIVRYVDDQDKTKYITPDDDATLKDDTSITDYGQVEAIFDVGYGNAVSALNAGKRHLARYKNPIWNMASPVVVAGEIKTKSGDIIPVAQVRAGKRLRLANWIGDVTGQGTGATFLLSHTSYDAESDTVAMSSGPPPELIFPAYLRPPAPPPTGEGDGEGGESTTPGTPPKYRKKRFGVKKKPKTGSGMGWS